MSRLAEGFTEGYACLSAWADLLDRINVFPVADADTGTNLRISLGPLRSCDGDRSLVAGRMVRGATGNSGNIAAAFFSALLAAESLDDLAARAAEGRARARQAVAEPRDGTMLSVFDSVSEILSHSPPTAASCEPLLQTLKRTVLDSTLALADLRAAGVVDAGALAMYIFFDGFFRTVTGYGGKPAPLLTLFPGRLTVAAAFHPPTIEAFCVDAILEPTAGGACNQETVARLGESVVVLAEQSRLKIHIHTTDPQQLRRRLADLGEVVGWSDQSLAQAPEEEVPLAGGCLHILTDAAGSLPRDLARRQRITLLDSYILFNDTARPESLCDPATIYAALRQGQRVTTAQASVTERQHRYRSVCEQFGPTLYLCVGSAFTGNYGMALAWQRQQDDHLFAVLDTGAASGRLGLIALLTSRRAARTTDADAVRAYARDLIDTCREYIFIDCLRYLVAGGRVSRAGGWIGDLMHLKPVISPCREGVRRVGMVRNQAAQLDFALDKAATEILAPAATVLLLQYSDNQDWVTRVAGARLQALLPGAEIRVAPLSLTSGVHMGPGTWALAFARQD